MSLQDIEQSLSLRMDALRKQVASNEVLEAEATECDDKAISLGYEMSIAKESLLCVEGIANNRRGSMKHRIESVITEMVRGIYGADYRVELSYGVSNNRSSLEVEMVHKTTKGDVRRRIGGFGGGLADTMSVALRLMLLFGSKGQTDRVCVLDECFKHMDLGRMERVAEITKRLSSDLDMQVLFVSHHEAIREVADKTYRVSLSDGKSMIHEEQVTK